MPAKRPGAVREQLSWDVEDFEPEALKQDPAELESTALQST